MPSRLLRQRDVSNDPVLKTVCESVQSALNMPYISKHCFPDMPGPFLLFTTRSTLCPCSSCHISRCQRHS